MLDGRVIRMLNMEGWIDDCAEDRIADRMDELKRIIRPPVPQ